MARQFSVLTGMVMEIFADQKKPEVFKGSIFQQGNSDLVKVTGIPKNEVNKMTAAKEIRVKVEQFPYVSDKGNASIINKFVALV
jgi:hypothetical protein